MDVMAAFLNSLLQEEVYLKQPERFVDKEHPHWVWRVKASRYGQKQAPKQWNALLTKKLLSYGLTQSKSDPVLFTYCKNGKVIGAFVVNLDDFIDIGQQSFLDTISTRL